VLAHPQRLRHFRHLQQRSPPQLGFLAGRRAAEYRRRPRVGFRQPQQDPHRRGFSRAIRSQQGQQFAALDSQIDSPQRFNRSVPFGNSP
jgi:hypothetical protein